MAGAVQPANKDQIRNEFLQPVDNAYKNASAWGGSFITSCLQMQYLFSDGQH